jgi:hypothetical protein
MYRLGISVALVLLTGREVAARNFPFELAQLSHADIEDFPAVRFADKFQAPSWDNATPRCRAWPGTHDWPSDSEWKQFNASLGGALLRPLPPASACYQGEQYNETTCRWLVNRADGTHFWLDDPLTTLTQWPQGSTCTLAINATGTCTRGGFPEYVVNATSVKHIQAAVNFARNRNIRLVIK